MKRIRPRLAAHILISLGLAQAVGAAEAPRLTVTVLSPHDGVSMHAPTLDLRVLLTKSEPSGSDLETSDGEAVQRLRISLDGTLVQTVVPRSCRRDVVVDVPLGMTAVLPGAHVVSIAADQRHRGGWITTRTSVHINVDPTLPLTHTNRVEEAATPLPFACIVVPERGATDNRFSDDHRGQPGRRGLTTFRGSVAVQGTDQTDDVRADRDVPESRHNGFPSGPLDVARDRILVAFDNQVTVFEPNVFHCEWRGGCSFRDDLHAVVQQMSLEETAEGVWAFSMVGNGIPSAPRSFVLRIGRHWGGWDFIHGRPIVALEPSLDPRYRADAVIGVAGGTLQLTDATGTNIRLDVPAGALTADTAIAMTPLATSPLVTATHLHPGVLLEPEGLQFASAATLAFDVTNTSHILTRDDFGFLVTSPTTTLPLFSRIDVTQRVLTVGLDHFSLYAAGTANTDLIDLAAWADPILSSTDQATFSELASLAAERAIQLQVGCSGANCIDVASLTQKGFSSLRALVGATCGAGTSPTDETLGRLLTIEAIGEALGVDTQTAGVLTCATSVLRALISDTATRAVVTPSDTNLARLINYAAKAQLLGLDGVDTFALQQLDFVLRTLVGRAQKLCSSQNSAARALLARVEPYASAVVGVDPTLATDVANALNSCAAGHLALTLDGAFGYFQIGGNTLPYCLFGELTRLDGGWACPPGAPLSPPAEFVMPGLASAFSQLSPNMVGWDVDTQFVGPGPDWVLPRKIAVDTTITTSGPGTLTIQVSPSWTHLSCVTVVNTGGEGPPGSFILCEGDRVSVTTNAFTYDWKSPGATSTTIPVDGGAVHLGFELIPHTTGSWELIQGAAGQGRLMTVTFTPAS